MINFASLFGSFNRGSNSVINDLLQKPDTTLDQLLDIETFPNEYKSGNNKIIEYMKYPKYQALVQYVTVEGPADNQKKGYKFPMVAADILSVENNIAIDYFLPDNDIQVDVEFQQQQEFELEVDDNDEQYLTEQTPKSEEKPTEQDSSKSEQAAEHKQSQKTEQQSKSEVKQENQPAEQAQNSQQSSAPTENQENKIEEEQSTPPKKKKIIKQTRLVKKIRKQKQQPLMNKLLSYYEGPVNYTLAGYNCKVLTTLFNKKPANFINFLFKSQKNYVKLVCSHIESKSVGDLITKILVWENTQFVQERVKLYDHLIQLMSQFKESHVISNLAYTINEIIEKTAVYIKSKANTTNNKEIVQTFFKIFYRTSQVHKIINNAMDDDQNKSGYNSMVLHAYLNHTEIQTFNSFKIEEVLEAFISKAAGKLRNIPNRRTLGMGRLKIVQIFSFLIRKERKFIEEENSKNEISGQLLQQLYIHSLIAGVSDFFSILIKLVQSFDNNNILHNEVFKILESVLKQPQQNGSALQELLLNDENVLLKFIISQAEKDKQIKNSQKHTRRRGYIGHLINICRLIDQIDNNELLSQKIKLSPEFQEVLNTMVAVDITDTNKNLAGYQMKKNPAHQIMFQKEDILTAYADFLNHCPKPQFEPEQRQSSQDQQTEQPVVHTQPVESAGKIQQQSTEKQLQDQQLDEQKFNEVAAKSEVVDQSNPKFWITHINYDVQQLMKEYQ